MKKMNLPKIFVGIAISLALCAGAYAQDVHPAKPKYSADVPKSILTPDKVQTESLGTLEFFDGMPNSETLRKVYDNLDLTRGVTVFLDALPITSIHAILRGQREAGVKAGEVGIFENIMDARSLYLTGNTTVVYVFAQLDLSTQVSVCRIEEVAGNDQAINLVLHRRGDQAGEGGCRGIPKVGAELGREIGQTAERGTQVYVCTMQE